MAQFQKNTFATVYKDDFNDSANFYRILFNSGKALQARELTQMQTIIQEEVAKFARNIFKEGAAVRAGAATLQIFKFIKLDTTTYSFPTSPSSLIGTEFTVQAPNPAVKFKVVDAVAAEGSDPATLYVRYTDTLAITDNTEAPATTNGSVFINGDGVTLQAAASSATGFGTRLNVASGDYFTQSHFVYAPNQSIYLSKYTSNPTEDFGFKVVESIVTATDDITLYDNQGAAPNETAPGADRYRIRLVLTKKSDIVEFTDNFVFVGRVVNGLMTTTADGKSDYNIINDLLAQRTKDESGNYIVKAFVPTFKDASRSSSTMDVNVAAGVAYVEGYRIDVGAKKLTIDKARDSSGFLEENIVVDYGNWVYVNTANNVGLPSLTTFETRNLRNAVNYGGSTIGTCRVRSLQKDGANLKAYLFEISMDDGQNFRDVRSIGGGASDYFNIVLENGIARLHDTLDNSLLFELSKTRPLDDGVVLDDITFQEYEQITTTGTSETFTPAAGTSFNNLSSWIITQNTAAVDSVSPSLSFSGDNVVVSGLTGTTVYDVYKIITKSSPTLRTKTLQTRTDTFTYPTDLESDGIGNLHYTLGHADIYSLDNVKLTNASGEDVTSSWVLDNGARDNYYALGRLIPAAGTTPRDGDFYVQYKNFDHSTGNYFSVNSYPASIGYHGIPNYTKANGQKVSLRDVIDLRPTQNSSGAYSTTTIAKLPLAQTTIPAEVNYYLPRKDALVLRRTGALNTNAENDYGGEVVVVKGASSFDPKMPSTPSGALTVAEVNLNPYTLSDSDLSYVERGTKGYQMSDISAIEDRISRLEELATLNLLEASAANLLVLDSNNTPRTKSGFFADNFKNYVFSHPERADYRAVIDEELQILQPLLTGSSTRLIFDSDATTNSNVIRKSDLLMLNYDHETFVDQDLATETINVNPYEVIVTEGFLTLSPSFDNWNDTVYTGSETNRTATINHAANVITRGSGSILVSLTAVQTTQTFTEQVGDRVVGVRALPFMRSIEIQFEAIGLRPNSTYFPFFQEVDVSAWCRDTNGGFDPYGARVAQNFENTYSRSEQHPDGATSLVSNNEGVLTGSFFVPSGSQRFRTGTSEFKLLDISVNDESGTTSYAKARFSAEGTLTTRQRIFRTWAETNTTITITRRRPPPPPPPPPPADPWGGVFGDGPTGVSDPLAQSFFVDVATHPNGVFLTKATAYFNTKEEVTGPPAVVEIRTMVNGFPSQRILGSTYLSPSDINIPSDLNDMASIRAAGTTFEFREPIYLAPGEYAFIIKAESIAYNVYVAKTYEFIVGTNAARVTKQPTLGVLFASQNASTWNSDQERDLMFKLEVANFETSGTATLVNVDLQNTLLQTNPFSVDSGSAEVTVYDGGHGFNLNDYITISGATGFAGIRADTLNDTHQITAVDWASYKFTCDSDADFSLDGGGNSVLGSLQHQFTVVNPIVSIGQPGGTTISASADMLTGSSFANNRNSASNSSYANINNVSLVLNQSNQLNQPYMIASSYNETQYNSGNKSFTMRLNMATANEYVSPVIDLQGCDLLTQDTVIDWQDSSATSGRNVPLNYISETSSKEGSSASKHLTYPITLNEPAVGLKILLSANRPSEADFYMYYRTATDDTLLTDQSWNLVEKENQIRADENPTVFREYEYLVGGPGGSMPEFTQFELKIVMVSTNSAKYPTFRDLRAIALAV
jgi:hypothetical protein